MRNLAEQIVHALVDEPRSASLTTVELGKTTVFELRCQSGDVGKIIGKNGKTISAIRALLGAAANRENRRVVFEIAE